MRTFSDSYVVMLTARDTEVDTVLGLSVGALTALVATWYLSRELQRWFTEISSAASALANGRYDVRVATPTWVSPNDLVSMAIVAVADRYRAKNVTLTTHIAADLPRVCADSQRLAQVVGNLLDNALRHTPPHGCVTVAATALPFAHTEKAQSARWL